MSYWNNGKECCTYNCKCHDINTFLESVLHLNHALSEAIHAELVAIKEIKNVVSSNFLINLKKDLNNTLKLAMNKEMIIEMLLDEVKDRCEIIYFETECKHEKEHVDLHKECSCEECECEKYVEVKEGYNLEVEVPKEKEEDKDKKDKKEKQEKEENKKRKMEKQEREEEKKRKVEKQEREKKDRNVVQEEKILKKESENKDLDEQKKDREPKKHEYDKYENEQEDETYIIIRSRRR